MTATRTHDSTAPQTVLYMALELSEKTWKPAIDTIRYDKGDGRIYWSDCTT